MAAHLGGGATFNPATGVVTTPNYVIAGTTYNDVGSALGSLASGGAKQRYFNANSTLVDSTAVGVDSVAIGPNAVSTNAGDVALGNGAISAAPNSGAFTLNGGTVAAIAPTSVLSIGEAGTERQIQNVAAGVISATSTDAVNGSQLFTVATAANNLGDSLETVTGGGLTLNPDGTIATPAAISVGGISYANTTDAIEAGDAKADLANAGLAGALGGGAAVAPDGTVTGPSYTLAGSTYNNVGDALDAIDKGRAGLVRQVGGAPGTGLITVGAETGGTSLSVAGTDGDRVVTGVAAGAVSAVSTDAVNGAQLFATQQAGTAATDTLGASVAANLGGTAAYDPVTDTVSGLAINAAGSTQTNVTDAIQALDAANTASNNGLADTLGGGASVAPDGIVTAPAYAVQGSTYNNVGSALSALDGNVTNILNGTAGLVQQTGGSPGTGQITVGGATGGTSLSVAGTDGDRTLTGVRAGSLAPTSTDAVNGGQVNGLASSLATIIGGTLFDPVTGLVTTPGFTVQGSTYGDIASALGAVNTNVTNLNQAMNGSGIRYFHANSSQADSAPVGTDSIAIGPVSGAAGDRSISIGLNANAAGNQSIAIGTGNNVTGANSGAIGDPNTVTGTGSYALGNNNVINANNAFVIGNNVTIAAGNDGSVGLGNTTTVAAPNTGAKSINGGTIAATSPTSVVSVGSAGGERQITNVAAGVVSATSTDAINGSQLFAVGSAINKQGAGLAAALGGGASVAPDGTVAGPTYSVAGGTQTNVGAALSALDGAVTGLTNGTSGLVQQTGGAPGAGAITVGAATGGTVVNVAGTDGNRTVTGVAPGSLTPNSTDAVNGGQVNALASSAAAALGGGAAFDPATGQVTAPSYTVGGVSYGNVGDALTATNRAGVQYVPDAAGNPTNAVVLGNGTGPVSVGNVAPGAVTVTSRDAVNGAQLYGVQQTADASVQYVRNPDGSLNRSTVTFGTPGAPTQLRNVANGVAVTDGVNLGQLQSGLVSNLASANAYTDGKIAGIAFDLGKVAKRAYAGTASALALQSPALFEPGQLSMRGGVGAYRGEWALGLGFRATADNGRWSLSGGISGGPNAGVAASAGIDFVIGD